MNKKCAICKKERDLFELKFEADETDAGEEFSKYVCGSCWEVIAAIGRRVAKNILANSQAAQQSFAADETICNCTQGFVHPQKPGHCGVCGNPFHR